MTGHANIGGTWKDIASAHCNIGGAWREITEGYANNGGTWEQIYSTVAKSTWVVGVKVNLETGDCEYTDDAVGFTPAKNTNLNSWVGHKLLQGIKPVQRSSAGVFTDLNKNNLAKTVSGASSNISTTSADAFLEVPQIWLSMSNDGSYGYVRLSDGKADDTFHLDAFYGPDGELKDCFHYGLFCNYISSSLAYCIYNRTPTSTTTMADHIAACQGRGEFYDMVTYQMDTLLLAIYLVLYCNLDGQSALARGFVDDKYADDSYQPLLSLTSNNYGMAGSTSSGYSEDYRMSFLWIHDFWGHGFTILGCALHYQYKLMLQKGVYSSETFYTSDTTEIGPGASIDGDFEPAFDNVAGFFPVSNDRPICPDDASTTSYGFVERGGTPVMGDRAGPFAYSYKLDSLLTNMCFSRLAYRGGRN